MWKELELETVRENKRETESAYAFICAGLMYESMHDWVGPQVLHTFKTVSMKVSVHKHFANTWILCWASLIFYAVVRQICMSTHTDNKDSVFWRKQMVIIHWQHIIPWKTYMNWPATLRWDWTWPMTAPLCVQQVWISVCSWVSADKERKAVSIPSLAAGACAIQRICDLWEANFLWRSDSEPPCDCGMLFLETEKGSQHTTSVCRSLFNSEDMWLVRSKLSQRIWFWTTLWLWHVISANRERQSAYHVWLQKHVQFRGYVTCEGPTFSEDLNHPVTVTCWKQPSLFPGQSVQWWQIHHHIGWRWTGSIEPMVQKIRVKLKFLRTLILWSWPWRHYSPELWTWPLRW